MKKAVLGLINFYQAAFSKENSCKALPFGHCPFWPSCSEYAKLAIKKYGVLQGTAMSTWRILRCYPGRKPTIDLPK